MCEKQRYQVCERCKRFAVLNNNGECLYCEHEAICNLTVDTQ